MKKAYVLKVGEHGFVFGSAKSATAAFELLEAAEFHGKETWRKSGKMVEDPEGLETRAVNREELVLVTYEEHLRQEAIEAYKNVVNDTYYKDEKKQERIDRAAARLVELGIDPETINTV